LQFGEIRGARVLHWDDERIRDHHFDTAEHVIGEFAARLRNDPVFFERYFGDCPVWRNQRRFDRKTARVILRALCVAAAACPSKAATLLGLMRPWAFAAALGIAPRVALRRLAMKFDEFVIERIPLPRERRYSYFVSAHARTVRTARLESIHRCCNQPAASAAGRWQIERLDPAMLIGLHALERYGGRPFRWSEPVLLIRGVPAEGEFELRIETCAIRGDPLHYVIAAVVGGRVLPREFLATDANGRLTVRLTAAWAAAASDGVVLIASPLVPSRSGSPDCRRLGIPILSIESAPLIGAARGATVAA
jgi:hypothetical protein